MAPDTQNSATFDAYNPATGEVISTLADDGKAGVDQAVRTAKDTFERGAWNGLGAAHRARILWRVADLIDQNAEELAQLETRNNGMPLSLARVTIAGSAEKFRYNAGWITKIHGKTTDISSNPVGAGRQEFHAYTRKEPIPVAGLITPWNVPISMACAKLAPALAAGSHCVIKPAEQTPLTTMRIVELLAQAGVPEGVVNLVNGFGATTGSALVDHADVGKISFTGSTITGKRIVQAAAGNLKRVTLELGGKSPIVIFDDADVDAAIRGAAMGIFVNSGQACIVGSRLFVHRSLFDRVVDGIGKIASAMVLGDGAAPTTQLGPLISKRQLDCVKGFVDDARADGAAITAGGQVLDRPGYFMQPTVVTRVSPDMSIFRDEVFGPVLTVIPFDDEQEVVALANDSRYGLAAGMWTRDVKRAHRVARALQAGTVWVNCQLVTNEAMPFGGHKQSGWGCENGAEGIEAYMQTKSVFVAL